MDIRQFMVLRVVLHADSRFPFFSQDNLKVVTLQASADSNDRIYCAVSVIPLQTALYIETVSISNKTYSQKRIISLIVLT